MEIVKNLNPDIFRAYDIRGEYPTFIDEDTFYTIGLGYGSYIKELGKEVCIVGYDNRLSSVSLFNALTKGILETGINVINIGLVTTPLVYFARSFLNIYSTIMITASHNPGNENGLKFSFDEAGNVGDTKMFSFYKYLAAGLFKSGNGTITTKDIKEDYIKALTKDIKLGKRLKIVLDLGNGVTGVVAKNVFNNLNVDATYLFDQLDGTFPNHHPDPSIKENMFYLIDKVKELNADLGIGFDGDGDRLGIVDNLGEFHHIDSVGILYVINILNNSSNKKVIGDIKCTKALKEMVLKLGGEYIENKTGASYMMPKVKELNAALGLEYSGHVYFNDRFMPITSGIYSVLRLLEILSNENNSLSDLLKSIPIYYKTDEIKVPTTDEMKFKVVEEVAKYAQNKNLTISNIDGIKIIYPDGWALVRASNTGPNLTLMFEATSNEKLKELEKEYLDLVNLYNK